MARPDCVYAVNRVARHLTTPTRSVITAAKRVLRYLVQTSKEGVRYSPEIEKTFVQTYGELCKSKGLQDAVAFSDSDFAGCCATLRSSSGSVLYFKGVPVAWSSRRQTLRALSTCEAEYIALYDTLQLVLSSGYLDWFRQNSACPNIFCDNQSAISVSETNLPTKKTKHFMLRLHQVREYARDIAYVPTGINRADPLTKPMPKPLMVFRTPTSESLPESKQGVGALYCVV